MKKILAAAVFLSIPLSAFAGGSMGGGGLGAQEELAPSLMEAAGIASPISIPDLGLDRIEVSSDTYRRARMRLSAGLGETSVTTKAGTLDVKSLSGGIVDLSETSQLTIAAP